jgi:hypothetical protein
MTGQKSQHLLTTLVTGHKTSYVMLYERSIITEYVFFNKLILAQVAKKPLASREPEGSLRHNADLASQ